MSRRASLLGQFTDLAVEADDPHRLAERTVEVVMALVNGRSGGVFAAADERLTLFASRGIDQHVLDAIETLWGRAKDQLRRGQPIYVPDTGTDKDLARATAGGPASLAVFPVFDGEELVALLYVDSAEPELCPGTDLERLAK